MSLADTIQEMLETNVDKITIGNSPNKLPFVALTQQIPTGAGGDMILVMHQREGKSIAECFNKIVKDMEHCAELKTHILQPPPRN